MAIGLTKMFIVASTGFILGAGAVLWSSHTHTATVIDHSHQLVDVSKLKLVQVTPGFVMSQKDLECLAKNIYFEAALEPVMGKYAVAQVTLNRLRSGNWGNSICSVVYAPHQFSWTEEPRKRQSRPGQSPLRGEHWDRSLAVAYDVAEGRRVLGLSNALFYHADYVKPFWRSPEHHADTVGRHIFYNQARGTKFDLTN